MSEAERLALALHSNDPHGLLSQAAAELRLLQADNDALRKLLQSTRSAMVESMRFYGQSSTNWTHMIAAIDAALAARPRECRHAWASADNPHVSNAVVCLNCGDVRAKPGGQG